ncbi:hypothetical protein [Desulfotomaculum copahuensis]|uniref:Uncharacterized protein n=1 Tax=Desulfotomaculum copahuensis TaxID=1838280 RepID=A0A1B7LHM3_9FIRM|nr:hypothetical protein [Desulfotomaculum copahuensis]OAT85792.1 hypothetical protein A6M21_04680 [Desulfotomaculum copahuensis]
MLNRLLTRTSPWTLLLTGLAAGILISPGIRKGLRTVAVQTTKAALSLTDAARSCSEKASESWNGVVTEARAQQESRNANIKSKMHSAGIAAVGSGLDAVDKVKAVTGAAKQKWDNLVAEAREYKKENQEETPAPAEEAQPGGGTPVPES